MSTPTFPELARASSVARCPSSPPAPCRRWSPKGTIDEEFDKRISAAILSGAPGILLDNLQRPLEASALESILTEATATIRSFGQLSGVTVPFRALVVITANNVVLRRDMLRRILPVRIVVDTDEPEARQFDFDPYTEAKRDRLAILAAGFTIIRAWWQVRETEEGRRIRATTLGSFEQWADLVAGAVEWLTGINPITLIEERKAEDPKRGDERQVIAALHAYFGEATWTAKEAIGYPAQRVEEPRRRLGGTGMVAWEALNVGIAYHCGIPSAWVDAEDAEWLTAEGIAAVPIDPADPPRFESQAAYLRRHGLFMRGEERRLTPTDFEPEEVQPRNSCETLI